MSNRYAIQIQSPGPHPRAGRVRVWYDGASQCYRPLEHCPGAWYIGPVWLCPAWYGVPDEWIECEADRPDALDADYYEQEPPRQTEGTR